METLYLGIALFLLLTLVVGMWRVLPVPHAPGGAFQAGSVLGAAGVLLLLSDVH